MKNKYNLPQEVLETLADIGYTLEVVEDHVTDKLTVGAKKHISHIKGQMNQLREMLFTEDSQ